MNSESVTENEDNTEFSRKTIVRVREWREYAWGSLQLGVLSIHKLIALASVYH